MDPLYNLLNAIAMLTNSRSHYEAPRRQQRRNLSKLQRRRRAAAKRARAARRITRHAA